MNSKIAVFDNNIPDEPEPLSVLDAHRREHANLAPQGKVDLDDEIAGSHFTPEGDGEQVPNIPPDTL